jgi:hypothetical protein
MHRKLIGWSKEAARAAFRLLGYDLRRYPRSPHMMAGLASRLIADSALLPQRHRVELARALGVTEEEALATWEEESIHLSFECPWPTKREVLEHADVPLILGPWVSEIGFELLNWIPMLRRWLASHGVSARRVIAVSRGGVASWYAGLADRYVDVFDLCSPAAFLAANEKREVELRGKKQFRLCEFEQQLLTAAAARLNLDRYACVHPSLMYEFFRGCWRGVAPVRSIMTQCDYGALAHAYRRPAGIPFRDYVAVKFYHSHCFPKTRANTRFVRDWVAHLARSANVVLLNTGLHVDDHVDANAANRSGNVFDATPLMDAPTNLETQTAIVAHAQRLYATYGGFSYLGPLVRVPTLSFHSAVNYLHEHLDVAHRAFNQNGMRYSVVATQELESFLHSGAQHQDEEARQAA